MSDCETDTQYFPQCNDCPTGNLTKRPFLSVSDDRTLEIGEEVECDIKGPVTDEKGKMCLSFSGQNIF